MMAMMMWMHGKTKWMMNSVGLKSGTAGGTALVVLLNISGDDLVRTVVLGALGAVVSFLVSWVMKWVLGRIRRRL